MQNLVIHPIEYYEIPQGITPIFLAGPIRGVSDWREKAIKILSTNNTSCVFFSPDRKNGGKQVTPGHENWVDRQRQWEQYYIRETIAHDGCVMFWLPKQEIEFPNSPEGIQTKAYGAITHIELGQVMVTHPDKMVAGIDPAYNERSTIINDIRQSSYLDLSRSYDPKRLDSIEISETFEETCQRVIGLLLQNKKL